MAEISRTQSDSPTPRDGSPAGGIDADVRSDDERLQEREVLKTNPDVNRFVLQVITL